MKTELKCITPEDAKTLLLLNTNNRPLIDSYVDKLAKDMTEGRWIQNGDTIRISNTGVLLDGQHRLAAIVKSGVDQTYLVASDLANDAFAVTDNGKPRTTGHVLAHEGIPHYNAVAAASMLAACWEKHGDPAPSPHKRPSRTELMGWIYANDSIIESVGCVSRKKWCRRFIGQGASGFCLWAFRLDDQDKSDDFFSALDEGSYLFPSSPILHLRERLIAEKGSRYKAPKRNTLALVFKAYKAFRDNREMKLLRLHEAEILSAFVLD